MPDLYLFIFATHTIRSTERARAWALDEKCWKSGYWLFAWFMKSFTTIYFHPFLSFAHFNNFWINKLKKKKKDKRKNIRERLRGSINWLSSATSTTSCCPFCFFFCVVRFSFLESNEQDGICEQEQRMAATRRPPVCDYQRTRQSDAKNDEYEWANMHCIMESHVFDIIW